MRTYSINQTLLLPSTIITDHSKIKINFFSGLKCPITNQCNLLFPKVRLVLKYNQLHMFQFIFIYRNPIQSV